MGFGVALYWRLWRFWIFGLGQLKEPIEFIAIKCVTALFMLTEVFTTLSVSSIQYGWSMTEPTLERHARFGAVEAYYYWNLFNQLPQLDIPKAFHWEPNWSFTDPLSGAMLVFYRLLVIIPVVAVLLEAYKRFRRPDREVADRLGRIEAIVGEIDRCSPFKTCDLNSPGAAECRQIPPFATGVAVRVSAWAMTWRRHHSPRF
jgi:hypothetical protein